MNEVSGNLKQPVFLPYQVSFHVLSHPHWANLCTRQEQFQQLLSSVHEHLNLSENGTWTRLLLPSMELSASGMLWVNRFQIGTVHLGTRSSIWKQWVHLSQEYFSSVILLSTNKWQGMVEKRKAISIYKMQQFILK